MKYITLLFLRPWRLLKSDFYGGNGGGNNRVLYLPRNHYFLRFFTYSVYNSGIQSWTLYSL